MTTNKKPSRRKRSRRIKKEETKKVLPFDASRSDFRITIMEALAGCEAAISEATTQYSHIMAGIERDQRRYVRVLRITDMAENCHDKRVKYNIPDRKTGKGELAYVVHEKETPGFHNGSPKIIEKEILSTEK